MYGLYMFRILPLPAEAYKRLKRRAAGEDAGTVRSRVFDQFVHEVELGLVLDRAELGARDEADNGGEIRHWPVMDCGVEAVLRSCCPEFSPISFPR